MTYQLNAYADWSWRVHFHPWLKFQTRRNRPYKILSPPPATIYKIRFITLANDNLWVPNIHPLCFNLHKVGICFSQIFFPIWYTKSRSGSIAFFIRYFLTDFRVLSLFLMIKLWIQRTRVGFLEFLAHLCLFFRQKRINCSDSNLEVCFCLLLRHEKIFDLATENLFYVLRLFLSFSSIYSIFCFCFRHTRWIAAERVCEKKNNPGLNIYEIGGKLYMWMICCMVGVLCVKLMQCS